ncbi:MAG: ferredoxin, partial [Clostridiales bacterium]|nr:ferredoxin [Clostridiales bacterium]
MLVDGRTVEEKAVLQVAELMAAAARTAPKAHGYDNLEVLIVTGEEKAQLAAEMRRICEEIGAP